MVVVQGVLGNCKYLIVSQYVDFVSWMPFVVGWMVLGSVSIVRTAKLASNMTSQLAALWSGKLDLYYSALVLSEGL